MASLLKKMSKRSAKDSARGTFIRSPDQLSATSSASQAARDNGPPKRVECIDLTQPEVAAVVCEKCKKQRVRVNGALARCDCSSPSAASVVKSEPNKSLPSTSSLSTVPHSKPKRKPEVRSKRLMKEYQDIMQRADATLFTVELIDGNLFDWNVSLHKIDPDSALHRDMVAQNVSRILLNISFPENFPFSPPFMRVVHPRISGGFILDGGAICMELLTPEGWSSAYQVEAIVLQFSALVVKGNGRLPTKDKGSFAKKDAVHAFKHLVKTHKKYGWVTPPTSEG